MARLWVVRLVLSVGEAVFSIPLTIINDFIFTFIFQEGHPTHRMKRTWSTLDGVIKREILCDK